MRSESSPRCPRPPRVYVPIRLEENGRDSWEEVELRLDTEIADHVILYFSGLNLAERCMNKFGNLFLNRTVDM
jgi:hypothetical protein